MKGKEILLDFEGITEGYCDFNGNKEYIFNYALESITFSEKEIDECKNENIYLKHNDNGFRISRYHIDKNNMFNRVSAKRKLALIEWSHIQIIKTLGLQYYKAKSNDLFINLIYGNDIVKRND